MCYLLCVDVDVRLCMGVCVCVCVHLRKWALQKWKGRNFNGAADSKKKKEDRRKLP